MQVGQLDGDDPQAVVEDGGLDVGVDRVADGPSHFRRVSSAPRSLSASDPKAPDDATSVRAV